MRVLYAVYAERIDLSTLPPLTGSVNFIKEDQLVKVYSKYNPQCRLPPESLLTTAYFKAESGLLLSASCLLIVSAVLYCIILSGFIVSPFPPDEWRC